MAGRRRESPEEPSFPAGMVRSAWTSAAEEESEEDNQEGKVIHAGKGE
jgi:hypothetical protein